jgi:Uma2 family endonuclease
MTISYGSTPMTATPTVTMPASQCRMTLAEYLVYNDGTDARYELENGVLVAMGTESTVNTAIFSFLFAVFLSLGLEAQRLGVKQKVEVRSRYASARDPDLLIHSIESRTAIKGRSEACLFLNEPNPLIVIEMVSPGSEGTENYQRDDEQKPIEYADRGILEFWQVDAARAWVRVGVLVDGVYQFETFQGDQIIVSLAFPELQLRAAAVLAADD